MYFPNYGLEKVVKKGLESCVSEDPSRSNMVRGTRHC